MTKFQDNKVPLLKPVSVKTSKITNQDSLLLGFVQK